MPVNSLPANASTLLEAFRFCKDSRSTGETFARPVYNVCVSKTTLIPTKDVAGRTVKIRCVQPVLDAGAFSREQSGGTQTLGMPHFFAPDGAALSQTSPGVFEGGGGIYIAIE